MMLHRIRPLTSKTWIQNFAISLSITGLFLLAWVIVGWPSNSVINFSDFAVLFIALSIVQVTLRSISEEYRNSSNSTNPVTSIVGAEEAEAESGEREPVDTLDMPTEHVHRLFLPTVLIVAGICLTIYGSLAFLGIHIHIEKLPVTQTDASLYGIQSSVIGLAMLGYHIFQYRRTGERLP